MATHKTWKRTTDGGNDVDPQVREVHRQQRRAKGARRVQAAARNWRNRENSERESGTDDLGRHVADLVLLVADTLEDDEHDDEHSDHLSCICLVL